MIKSIDELQELYLLKSKDIDSYATEHDLKSDAKIKLFIKMRLQLMLQSHKQQVLKNESQFNEENNTSNLNRLFIKRLINSEINLIKFLIEKL